MTVTWDSLAAQARRCVACPELVQGRTQVVFGDRPVAQTRLAFVGEAPGAEEDAVGRPFVGRAGQLLDSLLVEAGLDRAEVAVLNVLKCRPPKNRTPKPDEVARCRPFLEGQLELLGPELVVSLGLTATQWFLGRQFTLAAARGEVHSVELNGRQWSVLATYHPSAAIRFGPGGAPMAALRQDLALAAKVLG
jgi:uracil-DNA glycosylase family 4